MDSVTATDGAPFTPWLQQLACGSEVLLVTITVVAVIAAIQQASAFKLFEILKFIQEDRFRAARRTVIVEIAARGDTNWWENSNLEAAASTCCAHYDIVGNILQFGGGSRLQAHFVKHWSDSIIRTYEILHGFIERRRASGGNEYPSYQWLYRRALKHRTVVGQPWPSPQTPGKSP